MGTLVPVSTALRDRNGKAVMAGRFAVDHKPQSHRLLQDRRPATATEARLGWAELPGGEQLTQLVLNEYEEVQRSIDDLRTYFFDLMRPEKASGRNLVGLVLKGADFPECSDSPDQQYLLLLDVWGMGDGNSVDVAQATHVAILRSERGLRHDETLERAMSAPRTRT
eukprot:6992485-Heterocapsa_arctica.AAC.1